MQSSIVNDFPKVELDGHIETKLVPKFLLQVSAIELHNNLVSDKDKGGLKEARDKEII